MSSYKKIARADITLTLFEDLDKYSAEIFSTNGTILQPYDISTTLIGSVYKNNVVITDDRNLEFRWTKWQPSADNMITDEKWNERHKDYKKIEITKDDVDEKSIFVFEVYQVSNNNKILIASDTISIIDVNDLLISTNKPTSPYLGQVWIDDSVEPAIINMWNGYKWVICGAVDSMSKNLLRDTICVSTKHWTIINQNDMYPISTAEYLSSRFMRLQSTNLSDKQRGIYQLTTDKIKANSEYSLQFLYYSDTFIETYSNNINIDIYSINSDKKETLIFSKTVNAERNIKQFFYSFLSLDDTQSIKVALYGDNGKRFNFNIGEMALYNCATLYPWIPNPLDLYDAFDVNTLSVLLKQLKSDEKVIQFTYDQLYNNASFRNKDFDGDINEWLINKPDTTPTKWYEVLELMLTEYNNSITELRKNIETAMSSPEYDMSLLDNSHDKYIIELARMNKAFTLCQEFIADYKVEILEKNWSNFIVEQESINAEVGRLTTTVGTQGDDISKVVEELNTAKQEMTAEAITSKVQTIIKEDEEVTKFIESTAKQTAEGFNQEVVDQLTGQMSELNQNVNGFDGRITATTESIEKLSSTVEDNKKDTDKTIKTITNKQTDFEATLEGFKTTVSETEKKIDTANDNYTEVSEKYSQLQQTVDGFNATVSDINTKYDETTGKTTSLEERMLKVEADAGGIREEITSISKRHNYTLNMETFDGTVIRSAAETCEVYGKIYDWGVDVTDQFDENLFQWYRASKNKESDKEWNNTKGKGRKVITITASDIDKNAVFYFTVNIEDI